MQKKWQQGVALLFALGILGLLLVMALGFATNSIFDQMIASNSSNTSSSRVIANSGLERVRIMLQNYSDKMSLLKTGTVYDFKQFGILGYSHSPDTSVFTTSNSGYGAAKSDMLSGSRFFESYTTWNSDMTNNINWIYLKSDSRIIGRMAYLILNRADLDPAKLVKLDVDEALATEPRVGAEANEINLKSVNTAITADIVRRFNYSFAVYNAQPNPGVFDDKWIDYQFMFKRFFDGDPAHSVASLPEFNPAGSDPIKLNFQKWFICNSKGSPEAFWIDNNNDGKISTKRDPATGKVYSEEQIHRFNIARNWNTDLPDIAALYEKVLLSTAANGTIPNVNIIQQPAAGGTLWSDENFNGKGIPWLATFGMKDSGGTTVSAGITYPVWVDDDTNFKATFASVADRRRQIAANLVDYCKPVTVSATSDSTDWLTTPPTFTGNKKTPYIDEIGVALEAAATYHYTETSVPDDTLTVTVVLNGFLLGKLIDIYSTTAWGQPFTLRVKGKISYTVNINGVETKVTGQDFQFDLPSTIASPFNWNNGYGTYIHTFDGATLPASLTSAVIDVTAGPTITTVVNGVSVYVEKAILYDATSGFKGYDYSTINKTVTFADDLLNTSATKTAQSVYFSFQTEDPRQNLNEGDWHISTVAPVVCDSAVSSGSGTGYWRVNFDSGTGEYSGKINEQSDPAAAHTADATNTDAETVTEPAGGTLSTAFIREAPMVSPWELGFIHRGQKWQTLNLHKFAFDAVIPTKPKSTLAIAVADGVAYNIFSAGGGAYADGDANILDQIKMNTYPKNYKVDLNNKYQDAGSGSFVVIDSLLTNILSGSTLNATGINGGAAISAAEIASIRNAIIDKTYSTRAQLINDIALVTPISGYTTKASQDEIIGKFINLVDFDSYYTVILAVQTIKDVGGPVGTPITINKKLPGETSAKSIIAELGKFDLVVDGTKYYYADEITSTLKVQALVHKKTDGSCEILSVNYIY